MWREHNFIRHPRLRHLGGGISLASFCCAAVIDMGRNSRGKGKKKRGGGGGGSARQSTGNTVTIDPSVPLLDMGTRVEWNGSDGNTKSGTVVAQYDRLDHWPEDVIAPYRLIFDDGEGIFTDGRHIRQLDQRSLMGTEFRTGSQVECRLGGSDAWFPGTVMSDNKDWLQDDTPPYIIKFSYSREPRPFWGASDWIRAGSGNMSSSETPELRFKPGQRVLCAVGVGPDEKSAGTIIKCWYKEAFENDYAVPYQIQLDAGHKIFAPVDDDVCIEKSSKKGPSCWICFDNEMTETNLIVRDCACRGDENGFVHVECLVKLARSKVDDDFGKEPDSDDPIPYAHCITCKQQFQMGSPCFSALAKSMFCDTAGLDISNTWNKMATTMMCDLLKHREDNQHAMELLENRIQKIRDKIAECEAMGQGGERRWEIDLSNFLVDLSEVYNNMSCLDEMKCALDEGLCLKKKVCHGRLTVGAIDTLNGLTQHAIQTDKDENALGYTEQAIVLARDEDQSGGQSGISMMRLADLLRQAAVLHASFKNKEKALALATESLDITTRVYGEKHIYARNGRHFVKQIHESDS